MNVVMILNSYNNYIESSMVHLVVGEEVTKLKLSACLLLNNDTIHDILEDVAILVKNHDLAAQQNGRIEVYKCDLCGF